MEGKPVKVRKSPHGRKMTFSISSQSPSFLFCPFFSYLWSTRNRTDHWPQLAILFFAPFPSGTCSPFSLTKATHQRFRIKKGEKNVWWCFYDHTFLSIGEEEEVRKCRLVFGPPNDSSSPIKVKSPNK
ncbi:hypothetical protein NPIL_73171 [Nephila pilipes]|uniref:Uncharacterized protein n=1 Tax=Nephila pilipes TaxID=299642 RepID=A0A8X6T4Z8_NEPPI|nr:hypothetical protein NPIL_73171 [Nephila pilipes]